ncbi:MAG TPA: hypothetical protein VIG29_18395, partial [Vicinamibacteria bacterium]
MIPKLRASILLFLAAAPAAAESSFTFEDMLAIRTLAPGQPVALSSAGRWVAYVVTDLDDEWNVLEPRPTGHLYVQPTRKLGSARALTEGPVHGSFPVWSPAGERLAFFREDASGGRLNVWDAESGKVTELGARFDGRSYLAPVWSSDGTKIVFAAASKIPEPGPSPRVRVVESTDPRIPGDEFFLDRRRAALFVADVGGASVVPLLPEPALLRSIRLSSDESGVTYSVPSPDTYGIIGSERNDTFRIPLAGG